MVSSPGGVILDSSTLLFPGFSRPHEEIPASFMRSCPLPSYTFLAIHSDSKEVSVSNRFERCIRVQQCNMCVKNQHPGPGQRGAQSPGF